MNLVLYPHCVRCLFSQRISYSQGVIPKPVLYDNFKSVTVQFPSKEFYDQLHQTLCIDQCKYRELTDVHLLPGI